MAYSVHGSMVTQTPDEIRYEVVEDPREPGWILVLPLADLDAAWVESSTRGALDHGSIIVRSLAVREFEACGRWPQTVSRFS
mgnify:CR=1 FL=1